MINTITKRIAISLILALSAVFAVAGQASAETLAAFAVNPYDNLSTTVNTSSTITASGLAPGTVVSVQQWSFAPYSVAEGDLEGQTGVKVERRTYGVFTIDADGNGTFVAPVRYDIIPGGTMNYCENDQLAQKLCILRMQYTATTGEVVTVDQKLYFGRPAPSEGGGGGEEEPDPTEGPLTKDDCKTDGWTAFTDVTGFKNQGSCIKFVNKK